MKSSLYLFYFFILIVGTGVCQTPAAPGKAGFRLNLLHLPRQRCTGWRNGSEHHDPCAQSQ